MKLYTEGNVWMNHSVSESFLQIVQDLTNDYQLQLEDS